MNLLHVWRYPIRLAAVAFASGGAEQARSPTLAGIKSCVGFAATASSTHRGILSEGAGASQGNNLRATGIDDLKGMRGTTLLAGQCEMFGGVPSKDAFS